MSPDIEDLLRGELRGAASGAPQNLGIDDQDVLARGHRVIVRRRVMTVAGVAAATLAIAGTIGVLGPRDANDALPAIPTPTITSTPDPTPTVTPSGTPSVTTTPSAIATSSPSAAGSATPSETPTRTRETSSTPDPTPTRTPSRSPSSSPSPSLAVPPWSNTITVAGKTHRARLEPVIDLTGEKNYDLVVQTDGREAWRWRAIYPSDGIRGIDKTDPRRYMTFARTRYVDLVSIKDQPMTDERIGHMKLIDPADMNDGEAGRGFYVAVFAVPEPVGELSAYGPIGWVAKKADGTTVPMDE